VRAVVVFFIGILFGSSVYAQASVFISPSAENSMAPEAMTTLLVPPFHWISQPSSFLEPNQFSVCKEVNHSPLWLILGFGSPFLKWNPLQVDLKVGLEALVWSRLQILSDFRFPVETADYFFGAYAIWNVQHEASNHVGFYSQGESWRFRISHISSHDVDGKDSVHGGASSRYSREFVEITRQFPISWPIEILATLGGRAYFHQVTQIEPWIAIPASLSTFIYYRGHSGLYAFVSSADGPVWPSVSTGLYYQRELDEGESTSNIKLSYQYGASWAGTDANAKRSTINLQMDVRGF